MRVILQGNYTAILDVWSVRGQSLDLTITLLAYETSFSRHTTVSSDIFEADFLLHQFHRRVH
jgi:hypothetical protein